MGLRALADLHLLAQRYPELVREVRGKGLLIGLQLHNDAQVTALASLCLDRRLLVTPTRNAVLRLIPSLLLEQQEWEEGLAILADALRALSAATQHAGRAA